MDDMDKAIRASNWANRLAMLSLWLLLAPIVLGVVVFVAVLVWLL